MLQRNYVELAGHLGGEPEFRTTPNGASLARFRLATNERWGKQARVEWHDVVAWGASADFCRQHLKTGHAVFLEGQLRTSSWEKEGAKHYRTEVHVRPGSLRLMAGKERPWAVAVEEPAAEGEAPAPTEGEGLA